MASTELLYFPSSPPRQFSTFDMSSSPPLPSLADLLQKESGTLKSRIQAAPITTSLTATFSSAATLPKETITSIPQAMETTTTFKLEAEKGIRDITLSSKITKAKPRKTAAEKTDASKDKVAKASRKTTTKPKKDTENGAEEGVSKPKKVPKARVKKSVDGREGHEEGKVVVPRKPRVKKADKDLAPDDKSKENPARKSRAKKVEVDSQPKLAKGRVTKPSSKSKVSASTNTKIDPFTDPAGFGLADAVRRRVNWTPPPLNVNTTSVTPFNTESPGNFLASGGATVSSEEENGFTNLMGSFGFTTSEASVAKKSSTPEVTRKRKLIDLVNTSVSKAAVISPRKEKAPKKKARTITDQATSAYLENEETELPSNPAPLLQYFALDATNSTVSDGFKIPRKPRSKSPAKVQKAKKGSALAPILLSPESALKQVRNQDYVFGTSSQLAREDSPTLLRDLHDAMQASNEADLDSFTDDLLTANTQKRPSKTALSTKRNLWSAAARDAGGELMEVEMLDLAESSPAIARVSQPQILATIRLADPIEEGWHDIETMDETLLDKSLPQTAVPEKRGPVERIIDGLPNTLPTKIVAKKSPTKLSIAKDPGPVKSASLNSIAAGMSNVFKIPKMPDFSAYTTAKLEKEIKSYGFKPVKGRNQMIALMVRCWEGKHGSVLGDLDTNAALITPLSSRPPPSSQAAAISSKLPGGRIRNNASVLSPAKEKKAPKRKVHNTVEGLEMDSDTPLSQIRTPKKSSKMGKGPLEEIEDSDSPLTPSPPRGQASQAVTIPAPLELLDEGEGNLSPESLQTLLFSYISRAVLNTPPATNSQTPSWHEKILLYDPIILEDLTVWLNTGALEKVGWDGEVEPKEVKKWCESKSICCLWRENLRGGARSRY